jgi:hypothetical protein
MIERSKKNGAEDVQQLVCVTDDAVGGALVLRAGDHGRERDVTINIAMPRALHRRMSVTCSALEISLKEALIRAARVWTQQNHLKVVAVLDASEDKDVEM